MVFRKYLKVETIPPTLPPSPSHPQNLQLSESKERNRLQNAMSWQSFLSDFGAEWSLCLALAITFLTSVLFLGKNTNIYMYNCTMGTTLQSCTTLNWANFSWYELLGVICIPVSFPWLDFQKNKLKLSKLNQFCELEKRFVARSTCAGSWGWVCRNAFKLRIY